MKLCDAAFDRERLAAPAPNDCPYDCCWRGCAGTPLVGGKTPVVIGTVFFFVAIVFCACLLPMQNIVNERKKQTLPFVMSLPVSSARYGAAKLVSTVGMFLAPWVALLAAGTLYSSRSA